MYYITKDNDDHTKEIIENNIVDFEEAKDKYHKLIKEQSKEYHILKTLKKWRTIRLFDSNGNQIMQES